MIIGAILGLIFGQHILWIAPFGSLFVRLLKMIVMPIIISTLICGAASISPATLGKVGIRIVLIYLLTSAFAVFIGLLSGVIFHPSADLNGFALASVAGKQAASVSLSDTLLGIVPTNVFSSIVQSQVLPVIFFSILFGLGISYLTTSKDEKIKKSGDTMLSFFNGVSQVMTNMVGGIMQYAPIGVLALIAEVFAKQGAKIVGSLGMVTVACFSGYLLQILLVYVGMITLFGLNPRKFWHEAKNPFVTGLGTRSSYGTLPVTMQAAENLGVSKDIYSFSLPLGATINMDGTAIYQGVCATFICLTATGAPLTPTQMGIVILTATLMSIGTAGVPGAGALMLLMVLDSIGLKVEAGTAVAAAYAMILGIDAILDMGRTALNVTGDLASTSCVAKSLGQIDEKKFNKIK
ncbi:MAG: dicarboxylate/amino acid:cation symporter [Spirochaetia bacterium]|jgi:Na+/H+-dicarboxylate symporter|nr:dicarboxylate/amino acid:cation symporter [Spirochaetia bacterium]